MAKRKSLAADPELDSDGEDASERVGPPGPSLPYHRRDKLTAGQ